MIQIHNLTEYQVEMLDHMWSLDSIEEYEELDNLMDDCKDAKEVLKKFAL